MTILASTASPAIYVFGGALLLAFGGLLASDYRGLGTRYVRITLPNSSADTVRRYRLWYGVAAVIGLLSLVSGILGS